MSCVIRSFLQRTPGCKVAVVGDAILDQYVEGSMTRLCPDAPAGVVDVRHQEEAPGGAANVALNAAHLGGDVRFLSVVGSDAEGEELLSLLSQDLTLDVDIARKRRTLTKTRIQADRQLILRLDQGTTSPISLDVELFLRDRLDEALQWCDVLLISDYEYGIWTDRLIDYLRDHRPAHLPIVVDAKRPERFRSLTPAVVKPNYHQAIQLLSTAPSESRLRQIASLRVPLLERTQAKSMVVTFDREGSLVLDHDRDYDPIVPRPTHVECVSGAGDAYLSALGLGIGAGLSTLHAAEVATAVADVVVAKPRTASCTFAELLSRSTRKNKLIDSTELSLLRSTSDRLGQRLVFTNGCFDILHRGHVEYLNQARSLGDRLIVGLNTDESVRRLKGPKRPLNSLHDRVEVLAGLACVDHIIPFAEETPIELIKRLRPHIFVKGGDYTRDRLPEAGVVESLGGVVRILPYLHAHSTTSLVERIKRDAPLTAGK